MGRARLSVLLVGLAGMVVGCSTSETAPPPAVVAATTTSSPGGDATGSMQITMAIPCCDSQVHLQVEVFEPDGTPADDARVVARFAGPNGETAPEARLDRLVANRYGADPTIPSGGVWTVQVTSTAPRAESTATFDMTAHAR